MKRIYWWGVDYLWAATAWGSTLFAPKDPEHYATGTKRPLVVLPGVYENWQFLRPLINRLHRDGYPVHVVPQLGTNRRPIPTGAEIVLRRLTELDLTNVVLVAHSKGGLVGKLAMLTDEDHRIASMVSINTPYHGSSRTVLLPWPALTELRDPSDLFNSVAAASVDHRITSIAARVDEHVPEGSQLSGARNVTMDLSGHFRPIDHAPTYAAVVAAIEATSD